MLAGNLQKKQTLLPDVVWVLGLQVLHQRRHRGSELEAGGERPLQVDLGRVALGEELFDERVRGLVHGLRQVAVQQVVVLVHEALRAVQHLHDKQQKKEKERCVRLDHTKKM